jgi:hypothetical protein
LPRMEAASSRIRCQEDLPRSWGPRLLQLTWMSVTCLTLIACSAFCSPEAKLLLFECHKIPFTQRAHRSKLARFG